GAAGGSDKPASWAQKPNRRRRGASFCRIIDRLSSFRAVGSSAIRQGTNLLMGCAGEFPEWAASAGPPARWHSPYFHLRGGQRARAVFNPPGPVTYGLRRGQTATGGPVALELGCERSGDRPIALGVGVDVGSARRGGPHPGQLADLRRRQRNGAMAGQRRGRCQRHVGVKRGRHVGDQELLGLEVASQILIELL